MFVAVLIPSLQQLVWSYDYEVMLYILRFMENKRAENSASKWILKKKEVMH